MYDRIKNMCEARKVSISKVERECSLAHGLIATWKDNSPRAEALNKVAQYFGVTMDYLYNGEK